MKGSLISFGSEFNRDFKTFSCFLFVYTLNLLYHLLWSFPPRLSSHKVVFLHGIEDFGVHKCFCNF